MMHPALQLRAGQHLTVTPQLQQAIGLLQLSSQELEQKLRAALDANVFLDEDRAAEDDEVSLDSDELDGGLAVAGAGSSAVGPEIEPAAPEADLKAHLLWQVGMSSMSDRDRTIAEVIVDAVDEDGYLETSPARLLGTLAESGVTRPELEAVRQAVLHMDPVGCAARDLAECLKAQLSELDLGQDLADCAAALAEYPLEELATAEIEALSGSLGYPMPLVGEALTLIRSLQPFPGRRLGSDAASVVVPDVVVRRRSGRWVVELNPDVLPRVRLNRLYESLLSERREAAAHGGMQSQLKEARWLVRSVQMRNETLLKVAAAIMRHQAGFLERGELAMKPMVLREIAEAIDMHESTVSRVTTRKYIQTPRGNFELKYFFSSRLSTRSGSACSGTAVRALVRQLIDDEDPARPLSDGQIGKLLASRGVRIARRTVAKYREAMQIPPVARRQSAVDRQLTA